MNPRGPGNRRASPRPPWTAPGGPPKNGSPNSRSPHVPRQGRPRPGRPGGAGRRCSGKRSRAPTPEGWGLGVASLSTQDARLPQAPHAVADPHAAEDLCGTWPGTARQRHPAAAGRGSERDSCACALGRPAHHGPAYRAVAGPPSARRCCRANSRSICSGATMGFGPVRRPPSPPTPWGWPSPRGKGRTRKTRRTWHGTSGSA